MIDLRQTLLIAAAFMVLSPLAANAAHDEPDIIAILAELEANRRAVVEENMALKADAGPKFWQRYEEYRSEIAALEQRGMKLLTEFRQHFDEITDDRANQIMAEYFNLEMQTLQVREKFVPRFNAVLSAKQTMRFYQIEIKLDSIIQADVSSVTPLVED